MGRTSVATESRDSLLGNINLPKNASYKTLWRTPCTITGHSASDVDISIDVRDFDFHAIGDPSISRRNPVMLLQLSSTLLPHSESEYPSDVLMSSSVFFL